MLLNGHECVDDALTSLVSDDFYQPAHRSIFETMEKLTASGTAVDALTVDQQMAKDGTATPYTFQYLADLAHDVLTPGNIGTHIKIVREKSTLRKIINLSMALSEACYHGRKSAGDILGEAGDTIHQLAFDSSRGDVMPIRKALQQGYQAIMAAMKNKGGLLGIRTGFPTMDNMLSGLQKDQLIIIAARPGTGKTSFALNIIQNVSASQNVTCLLFSLEMSAEQLALRMLCAEAHVDMQNARTGKISTQDIQRLADAVRALSATPVYIDDSASINVTEMAAKARRLKRQQGLGMIVVDYLQLMNSTGRAENRNQEVSQMTRALKILAKELQVPVVVLSQLSRSAEKEGNKIPKLSDLRESGSIEQDADVVIFLQRDDYYVENQTEETKGKARIILAKQRNGPTGAIDVHWNGEYTRYIEEARQHNEQAI